MANYAMTCSCGHTMAVDGMSREDAVAKLQNMMTPEAITDHVKQLHPVGDPVPSKADVDSDIMKYLAVA